MPRLGDCIPTYTGRVIGERLREAQKKHYSLHNMPYDIEPFYAFCWKPQNYMEEIYEQYYVSDTEEGIEQGKENNAHRNDSYGSVFAVNRWCEGIWRVHLGGYVCRIYHKDFCPEKCHCPDDF